MKHLRDLKDLTMHDQHGMYTTVSEQSVAAASRSPAKCSEQEVNGSCSSTAVERRWNHLTSLTDLHLKAKARIWSGLSCMAAFTRRRPENH